MQSRLAYQDTDLKETCVNIKIIKNGVEEVHALIDVAKLVEPELYEFKRSIIIIKNNFVFKIVNCT